MSTSDDEYAYLDDQELRRELAKTFAGFCLVYLHHYFALDPADFFPELLQALEDHSEKRLEVIGFRGSAKSTFGSLAFVLWAALEHPDLYPFIIPLSDTGTQATANMAAIKHELDNNDLLKLDYGRMKYKTIDDPRPEPTLESGEDWQARNVLLDNGVRILARSRGQKIRGLRHRQHRPKLVVADDVESLEMVRTKENRDKTDRWLRGEVLPSIDELDGRLIVIGNWLHTDGLMARLKLTGRFKVLEFSLFHEDGSCRWPAKYPTEKALENKRMEMGEVAWQREMLLKVVPEEGAEILPGDIQYYDETPKGFPAGFKGHGADLAISKKETADCTAIVDGEVYTVDETPKIYIMPKPINAHLDFNQTMNTFSSLRQNGGAHMFFVEDVAYQKAAIQEMERKGLAVHAMRPNSDKRSCLRVAARFVKNGLVLFPRHGCEDLIAQLLGFGIEKHDDLVDAFSYLVLGLLEEGIYPQEVQWVRL